MKYLLILSILLIACQSISANEELYFYVPSEAAVINGVYSDHNQPLLISKIGSTENTYNFNINDYLPFTLSNKNAISGLAFEPFDGNRLVIHLSFSQVVDNFYPGDVIQCFNQLCSLLFSSKDQLGINETISVDAIGHKDDKLLVSFDSGFTYESQYIKPNNMYAIDDNGAISLNLIGNGEDLGMHEKSNLTAYDNINSEFFDIFASDMPFQRTNEVFFPYQVFATTPGSSLVPIPFEDEIKQNVKSLTAYDSLDTGWVIFNSLPEITVPEFAGALQIELNRIDGGDYFLSYVIESSDGTAFEGTDYQFSPTTRQWPHLDTVPLTFEVNIIDNNIKDGNRTFDLHLFGANELSFVDPSANSISITIIDDEGDLIFLNGFE